MRPIVMNGINEAATRGDFLDRAVMVTLSPIDDAARRDEASFWEAFELARPTILGALLDGVSAALRNIRAVNLKSKPRMADFAAWSTAAETGLGFKAGTFKNAYMANREGANEIALDSSPISSYIRQLMEKADEWNGTHTELLAELNSLHGRAMPEKKPKGWPESPRKLSEDMRRLAPNLRVLGIKYERSAPGRGRKTSLTLSNTKARTNSKNDPRNDSMNHGRTSPISPMSPTPAGSRTSAGDVVHPASLATSPRTSPVQSTETVAFGDVGENGDVAAGIQSEATAATIKGEL